MSHSCRPIVAFVRFKVPLVFVRRQSDVGSKTWTKLRDLTATGNGAWKVSGLWMILHSDTDLLSLKLWKLCELLQMTSKLRPVISSGQLPFITCWPRAVKLMVRCHNVCTGVYPVIEQTANRRIFFQCVWIFYQEMRRRNATVELKTAAVFLEWDRRTRSKRKNLKNQ